MNFQLTSEVLGLKQHLDGPGLEFCVDLPMKVAIQLVKQFPSDQTVSDRSSVLCTAIGTAQLDKVCEADIEESISRSTDGKWTNFIGKADRLSAAYSQIDPVLDSLRSATKTAISVLRWRAGITGGPVDPLLNQRGFVSSDGIKWLEISLLRGFEIKFLGMVRPISPSLEGDIAKIAGTATEEPIAHQLFREAWNQRTQHPRSALVIGVAAAEVGLKSLIGTLAPDAQWLVDEVQTPAIDKMLKKYLPTLRVKARFTTKTIGLPPKLLKTLKEGFEHRNKVVHAGKFRPSADELEVILRAVEDFLWICDLYAGLTWAAGYISPETLQDWKSEQITPG